MKNLTSGQHPADHLSRQPHVGNFVRHGFVVLEEFLNKVEVAKVQEAVMSLLSSPRESTCERPHNTLLLLRWNDSIVQSILTSERLIQLLSIAVGASDLKWISGYVSIKEAHSPPLWWHQDWWCWDHAVSYQLPAPQIAMLCYLTKTDPHNGALRVLPGSHVKSTPIHAVLPEAHGQAAAGIEPEHIAMRDISDQSTLSLGAGDAVVLDYRLLHGTHGNTSDGKRNAILLSFTPNWQGLPCDIRAHLIDHPAQPLAGETAQIPPMLAKVLPTFNGERQGLPMNRNAPSTFVIEDCSDRRRPNHMLLCSGAGAS
jgi:hypothetical protein